MNKRLFALLLSSVVSSGALSQTMSFSLPWLEPMLIEDIQSFDVNKLNDMEGLFDCGEEEGFEYCAEPTKYYATTVDSFVWVQDGLVDRIELTTEFTPLSYSEIQLNLRKDGFVLALVKIGDKLIDVVEELKHKPVYQVDREVVMFMNQGSITSARKLTWVPKGEYESDTPSRYVEFTSDGAIVSALFINQSN